MKKWFYWLIAGLAMLVIVLVWIFFFSSNVRYKQEVRFNIPGSFTYTEVFEKLKEKEALKFPFAFDLIARLTAYPDEIHGGSYIIKPGMNNFQLLRMLAGGLQSPVKVTFNNCRSKYDLAAKLGEQLELDSGDIIKLLNDSLMLDSFGFEPRNAAAMFIPNTYELYWNVSAPKFFRKMYDAYGAFWNESRKNKAVALNLEPLEVIILASIVQAEQLAHPDERPQIARVYLNRLKKGMRLESDPTLIFATSDFTIKRVLNVHKEINSPYNTYKNPGLPPGPIYIPDVSSIDAVLNPAEGDYIFMCAKEDLSGYHYFSDDLDTHNKYARWYRAAIANR